MARRHLAGFGTKLQKLKQKLNLLQKQVDALDLQTGPPGPQGPQGATGPSTGPAGGDLTGNYPNPLIGPDAVGPGEITDPNRSVNLPLTSFVNPEDPSTFDFTPSDGTSPDFIVVASHIMLEWDDDSDGGGANIADTDLIQTSFVVPPDFASGGQYALKISKDANTAGVGERVFCQEAKDGGSFSSQDNASITTDAVATYTFNPFGGLAAGQSVELRCSADNGISGTTADDTVRLHSVEFRYNAVQ